MTTIDKQMMMMMMRKTGLLKKCTEDDGVGSRILLFNPSPLLPTPPS